MSPGDGWVARHEKLPDERDSTTYKFNVAGHEGYLTAGRYPDGRLGEIFIKMGREGSTVSGLTDSVAIAVSGGLQHGVPLAWFASKYIGSKWEPFGVTTNGDDDLSTATSIFDHVFRYLLKRFPGGLYLPLRTADAAVPSPPPADPPA